MLSKIFKNTLFFKKTICWILILAFLLQSMPDITHAKSAGNKLADWISKNIGEKILTILPNEIFWNDNPNENDDEAILEVRASGQAIFGVPIPPLLNLNNLFDEGIGQNKTRIVDAEGKPRIPVPSIPSLCELRIMPPAEEQEEFLTIEERRFLNEACYDFLRLKRAAANQIFFSKHIFNETDPFSNCLMFKCKSSCNIRLGRIQYAISYMDILKTLVPGGILLKIKEILDLIQRIAKIWQILKPLYDLINEIPKHLKTLIETFKHGKVMIKSFGEILRIADEGGLRKALSHYADNVMKFGSGQSAASAYITNTQMDVVDLIKELQKEPGVDFLFQVGDEYKIKREQAQKIINDYLLAGFETPRQIIEKFRKNGEFLHNDGYENKGYLDAAGIFKTAPPLMLEEEKSPQPPTATKWDGQGMSRDGKYQTGIEIIKKEGDKQEGKVYISSDYGWTWTTVENNLVINNPSARQSHFAVAISNDGKYQTAGLGSLPPLFGEIKEPLYISSDYGMTWTAVNQGIWDKLQISIDGKYQSTIDGKYRAPVSGGGNYLISKDYGKTWTVKNTGTRLEMAMSDDGKHHTVTGIAYQMSPPAPPKPSPPYPLIGANIYTSSDHGETWSDPIIEQGEPRALTISRDGKYQTLAMFNWKIFNSSDYGMTWATSTINGSADSGSWVELIRVSDNGKYQAVKTVGGKVFSYISSDYGKTWTTPKIDLMNLAISNDEKYQTGVTPGEKIYTSWDNGVNWTHRANITGQSAEKGIVVISDDGKNQKIIIFGGIMYISSDYGKTWIKNREKNQGICYKPSNKWLRYFKEFYLEQKDLADKINKNEIPFPEQIARIIDLKENLLAEFGELATTLMKGAKEEAGETIDLISREYWATTTVDLSCPAGELVNDGKYYFCKFNGNACQEGWKPYQNWSATKPFYAYSNGIRPGYHMVTACSQECMNRSLSGHDDATLEEQVNGIFRGECTAWTTDGCHGRCSSWHKWNNKFIGEESASVKDVNHSEGCSQCCGNVFNCINNGTGWCYSGDCEYACKYDGDIAFGMPSANITQIGCIPAASSAGDAEPMDSNGQPTNNDQAVFYKFNTSVCPTGWTPYPSASQYWSKTRGMTEQTECCRKSDGGIFSRGCARQGSSGPSCSYKNCYDYQLGGICKACVSTNEHNWSNQTQESCFIDCLADINNAPDIWFRASANAQITQIGCKQLPGPEPWVCDYDHNLLFYDWDGMIELIQNERNNQILRALLEAMKNSTSQELSQFIDQPFLNWILAKKQKKLDEVKTQLTAIKNSIPSDQSELINLMNGLISSVDNIKAKFEDLKTKTNEIKNIWSPSQPGKTQELDYLQLKSNYVNDILETIKKSIETANIIIETEKEFGLLLEIRKCLKENDFTDCFKNLPPPPGAEPMDSNGQPTSNDQAVFYRFNLSACPAGWKPYNDWSATENPGNSGSNWDKPCRDLDECRSHISGSCYSYSCEADFHGSQEGCKSNAQASWHSWSNKSQEICTHRCGIKCETGTEKWGPSVTSFATIAQIGCVRSAVNLSDDIKAQLLAIFGENGSLKEIEDFLLPGPGAKDWASQNLKDLIGEYKCLTCSPNQECNKGFLNQIKCFEEKNTKTFKQIKIFIDTMIRTEKLIPYLETIRGKILALQPQLNLDYGCTPEEDFGKCMRKALADNPLGPTKRDFEEIKENIQKARCEVFDIYSLIKGGLPMKEDGTPATTSAETVFYKFSQYVCGSAACPAGWKPYGDWSTTKSKSGAICCNNCYRFCIIRPDPQCGTNSTTFHSFSNTPVEKVNVCTPGKCYNSAGEECKPCCEEISATITEIGCEPDEESEEYRKAEEIQKVLDAATVKVSQKVNVVINGISDLEFKVFGNEKIRAGCRVLDLVLKGEPKEIEEACKCINLAGLEPMDENGNVAQDLAKAKFFRFNRSSCPPRWKPYPSASQYWSATKSYRVCVNCDNCWGNADYEKERSTGGTYQCGVDGNWISGACADESDTRTCACETAKEGNICGHSCVMPFHDWSNTSNRNEECTAKTYTCYNEKTGLDEKLGKCSRTGRSIITQIGCEPADPSISIDEALLKLCQKNKENEINQRCSNEVIRTDAESLFNEVVIGDDQESQALTECSTISPISPGSPGSSLLLYKCQNLQNLQPKLKLWEQIAKFEKIVFKDKTYTECAQENWDWEKEDYAEKCADKICDKRKEKTGTGCGPIEHQNLMNEINEAKEFVNKDQCPNLSLSGFEELEKTDGEYIRHNGITQCVEKICRSKAETDYRDNQDSLIEPCDFYQEILQKALQNNCDKSTDSAKCKTARANIGELKEYCPVWKDDQTSIEGIPDLTSESANNSLQEVRKVCDKERGDLITTLEEIYDIYWILLGIKSGTLFFKGLYSSREAITRLTEIAKEFDKEKLKEIWRKIKETWESETKEDIPKSGLEISWNEFIKCKSNPAVINPVTIYDPTSKIERNIKGRTGSRGGLVCPDITKLFNIIDGNFAALRQSLADIEIKKRKATWEEIYAKLKGRFIPNLEEWLDDNFKIKDPSSAYVKYLEELTKDAKEVKKQAQMVWVLSSAINFAAANCTCGQSFCEFPVCVSNLSLLTPEVFGNGYCYVVYIFRVPLKHAAEKLERMLLKK